MLLDGAPVTQGEIAVRVGGWERPTRIPVVNGRFDCASDEGCLLVGPPGYITGDPLRYVYVGETVTFHLNGEQQADLTYSFAHMAEPCFVDSVELRFGAGVEPLVDPPCPGALAPEIIVASPPTPTPTPTLTPSPTPTPAPFPWTSFPPGSWLVGEQIVPGVYEATDVSGTCEWARLSRLDADGADVLFGDSMTAPTTVAILPTDAGFRASESCGWWSLKPPPTPTPTHTPTPTPTPYPADYRAPEQHTTLSSGWLHTCALRPDGTAICWGSDSSGQSSPPEGESFVSISSGAYHTCALRSDGSAVCWGANNRGYVTMLSTLALIPKSEGTLLG